MIATVLENTVRVVEIDLAQIDDYPMLLEDIYDDRIDVLMIRQAFCPKELEAAGMAAQQESCLQWLRPNPAEMVGENIQVLGVSLTPSGKTPMGPSLDVYLTENQAYRQVSDRLFNPEFNPQQEIDRVLGQLAKGRRVTTPMTEAGQSYAPYTVRSLYDGQGIGVHHDYHFGLAAYKTLAATADTTTLLSFITPLAVPISGGDLVVYALTLGNPNKPMLPNGRWDPGAIEQQYHTVYLQPEIGDLVIFASGRCLHQVTPVVGATPRITLGGFLSFDRSREEVLYWS
jgi:hapalindole-type alkaloid chlorinase